MEKPGQGPITPQIIDDPKLRSPLRNFLESTVTVALWAAWIYFIIPLLTLILWAISLREGYRAVFMAHGLLELFQIMRMAGWMLLLIFSINLIWVMYNLRYAAGRPKAVRKNTHQGSDPIQGIEQVEKNNRIELVIGPDGPKVTSATFLDRS